ncbi:MAG: hypothetical protein ABSF38_10590 [Verrucomicrobiota bacterium]
MLQSAFGRAGYWQDMPLTEKIAAKANGASQALVVFQAIEQGFNGRVALLD